MIDKKTHSKIMAALRKISFYHPQMRQALKASLNKDGLITCQGCGATLTSAKEVNRDHTIPVVPLQGFDSWDGIINRMFCGPAGIKVLCKTKCHRKKTNAENRKRTRKRA